MKEGSSTLRGNASPGLEPGSGSASDGDVILVDGTVLQASICTCEGVLAVSGFVRRNWKEYASSGRIGVLLGMNKSTLPVLLSISG